jgi:hypothetical protein
VLVFLLFYIVRFLSQRPVKTAQPILTVYTSNDAVLRIEVPFGGPTLPKLPGGLFSPKTTKNETGIGISGLKKHE